MACETISVAPIAGALGAEVSGVDLARKLPNATIAEIRQALLTHLVIFFRDQRLTPEKPKRMPASLMPGSGAWTMRSPSWRRLRPVGTKRKCTASTPRSC